MKIAITFDLSECDRRAIWENRNGGRSTKSNQVATYRECKEFLETEAAASAQFCGRPSEQEEIT